MRFHVIASILGCTSLLLASCGGTDNNVENDLQIERAAAGFIARFAPADGILPFPSNLLFSGSQDGTLNIPVEDANDFSDPSVALNTVDGFSTVAPMKAEFNLSIDAATVNSQTVHVYEVTLSGPGGAVTGVVRELTFGVEYLASVSSVDTTDLAILPLAPLKPATSYMVALTTGIQSTDGRMAAPEATYLIAKNTSALVNGGTSQVATLTNEEATALEPVRQLTNAQEAALAGQGLNSDIVALSWSFTTQTIGNALTQVKTNTSGVAAINPTSIGDTAALLGAGPGAANVYAGSLTVPYYLINGTVPTDPLNKPWLAAGDAMLSPFNSYTPAKNSDETIPLLLSIPKAGCSGLCPIVIFQHGVTRNRTDMLAVADAMAGAGLAVIAIDMPLHGITDTGNALYGIGGAERTFDLDLIDNTTSAAGPDGTTDTSGVHYINLSNLAVTRDNVRQSVADLFALFDSLSVMDYDNDTNPDFDMDRVYFFGHSLGGMVGTVFLSFESGVKDAVLAMPGSGIAKLLDGSATFGPPIAAGLAAAAGVEKGTEDYEGFMGAAQTLVDTGDPANYTSGAATNRGIMLFEVVGDGGSNLPDQVIPNNVVAAAPEGTVPGPLSGTDPLAALLGLTTVSASTASAEDQLAQIRFTAGEHGSVLDPTANATVTTVMQTAAATFLASDGLSVSISDTSVVE